MKSTNSLVIVSCGFLIVIVGLHLLSHRQQSFQVVPLAKRTEQHAPRPQSHATDHPRSEPASVTVTQSALPDRILLLLSRPDMFPSWAAIQKLQPEDLPTLKALYSQEKAVTNRMALMFALACIGDEEVVDIFQHSLFKEFEGRTLTMSEARVLKSTVAGLGILAARSDRAYELLKQGTDFGFWRFRRTWTQEKEYDGYPDWEFVDLSIQGLALSGRSDFPEILARFTRTKNSNYLWKVRGGVITAVLDYKLAREHGTENLVKAYLNEGIHDEFVAWKKTPDGQSWDEWKAGVYNSKQFGQPLPVAPEVEAIPKSQP